MTQSTTSRSRFLLAALILVSCIGCDQATKVLATRTLDGEPMQSYAGDLLRLELAYNPGGFLSLGAALPDGVRQWGFIGINVLMMAGLAGYLFFRRDVSLLSFVSFLLILAGGIGNLIDRISNDGLVTDFLNIGIGSLRTGVFNVADMAVMAGAFLLIILSFQQNSHEPAASASR